jgi:2',3'-cyclic-nucleotide 2'-phosphodiesterase (5'-nucleotidase family)
MLLLGVTLLGLQGPAAAAAASAPPPPPHTCAALGCGNHDSVCYCAPTCYSYGDCCPDYQSVCPAAQQQPLQFSDINLVVTTDMHSWLDGRPHQPHLNASIADLETMVGALRTAAGGAGKDIFVFDNGDINDGTGLSASAGNHVDYLSPLLRTVSYDALNCGNHELYQRGDGHNDLCPITGLQQNGYVAAWNGRYLTSNIVQPNTTDPVGERFTTLTGPHGTKLLVFGFLYNMEDHCPAVDVLKVEDVVRSAWFLAALTGPGKTADAIVVLAHMDAEDPLVTVINNAIRAVLGATKPVSFLTGHSHMRKFKRLDGFASSFEAGCKMDTVGYISFPKTPPSSAAAPAADTAAAQKKRLPDSNSDSDASPGPISKAFAAPEIPFKYYNIDGNTASLAKALNSSRSRLAPSAQGITVRNLADRF